jgi:hypothetical protein
MGLAPDTWGPSFWSTIHLLCLGAPKVITDILKLQYIAFFNALPYILPCGSCAQHLKENYQKLPLENYLDSQESLFRWSVLLHNEVNRSLNKPIWNETDAKMHWEKKINGTGNSTNVHSSRRYWMILLSIMIVFIVIAGIIFAVRKLSKK